MSFDAFGARRKTNWAGELTQAETEALLSDVGIGTSRGYTGHEHLDRTGLIHMNGRVYDPTLGRFLSADPIVQAPYFSQSYNRYTYVWNNPLGMNDPSGYEGNDSLGEDDKEAPEPEPEKKREKPKPGVHRLHAGNGYSIVYGDGSSDDGESEGARSDQEESEEPEEGELTTELIRGDSNNGEILEEGVLGQEGVDQEGIPTKLKLSIGKENPNKNTVVTDGNGGTMVQLSTKMQKASQVIQDAVGVHEGQHIKDFMEYGTNLEILKGLPAGKLIKFSPVTNKNVLERRGYRAEINYLENQMLNETLHPNLLYRVNVRLNTLDYHYNKYSN